MFVISVQVAPWINPYKFIQKRGDFQIKKGEFNIGDKVIIKTSIGGDLGEITKIDEIKENEEEAVRNETSENFILRKASQEDLSKYEERNNEKDKTIKRCEKIIKKTNLPIKIIDVLFAFDGGKMTFAFTSPSRIDFRELVKELVQEFHKSIKMHQVGARQETGLIGDIGSCGRGLCCMSFLKKLGNVSTNLILEQQLTQRGSDRLTGMCGRLKCCLVFEEEMYKELAQKLPAIGTKVKTSEGMGEVVERHVLKQTVVVKVKDTKIEVEVDKIKF